MLAKNIGISTGAYVVLVCSKDAAKRGLHAGDRVLLKSARKVNTAIINISDTIPEGYIGLTNEIAEAIKAKNEEEVEIEELPLPDSLIAIKNRLNGIRLDAQSAYAIIKDTVDKRLDKEEIAAFLVSLHSYPLDMEEAANISFAMVKTGERLELSKKRIFDKHSIGGVPGDKTSLLLVPIVAAAGLTIPKTSSRAITSAAGTADRAEVLMTVTLDVREMKRVVEKTNGCLVWGGAVHLAPADDIFIKTEYQFSIDPLMLPSIISKKKAVGSTDMVLDVPIGATMKIKNESEGINLVRDFSTLGRRLGINVEGALTNGAQPLGYAIGAAAEAKEALEAISGKGNAKDLIDKAVSLAGILFEMSGKKKGKELARRILERGLAEKKLREIIAEQGGDPKIRPDDIQIGEHSEQIYADQDGFVLGFDNFAIANIVKEAGAPNNKKAALLLNKKIFDPVKKGDLLFTIFSESAPLLSKAAKYARSSMPVMIGAKDRMLLKHIKLNKIPQQFILER
ncbi:MAG: AMP phosphorylase [Candidatus Micrarchaeia archaeon]